MAIKETKDANLNIRVPKELIKLVNSRAKELDINSSEYIRAVIELEARTKFFGSKSIATFNYKNVAELIKERDEKIFWLSKINDVSRKLTENIQRANDLEAAINDRMNLHLAPGNVHRLADKKELEKVKKYLQGLKKKPRSKKKR